MRCLRGKAFRLESPNFLATKIYLYVISVLCITFFFVIHILDKCVNKSFSPQEPAYFVGLQNVVILLVVIGYIRRDVMTCYLFHVSILYFDVMELTTIMPLGIHFHSFATKFTKIILIWFAHYFI